MYWHPSVAAEKIRRGPHGHHSLPLTDSAPTHPPAAQHISPVLLVLPLNHIESVSSSLCTASSPIRVPSTYCWDYCKNQPAAFPCRFTSPLHKLLQRLLLLRRELQGPTACSYLSPHLTPPSPLPTVYLARVTCAVSSSWKLARLRRGRLAGILGLHPQVLSRGLPWPLFSRHAYLLALLIFLLSTI